MSTHEHAHLRLSPEQARVVDRPPDAEVIQVVAVTFRRGEGCCDQDPTRLVTAYYSLDGQLLAERDSWTKP